MFHTGSVRFRVFACLSGLLAVAAALPATAIGAGDSTPVVRIELGDYSFAPRELTLTAGQPVVLQLVNTDGFVPHSFVLRDQAGRLDIDVNVNAGRTVEVALTPTVAGSYTFYCKKKLPFMESHRDQGMEGTLTVLEADP